MPSKDGPHRLHVKLSLLSADRKLPNVGSLSQSTEVELRKTQMAVPQARSAEGDLISMGYDAECFVELDFVESKGENFHH
tara:strand:- start:119 stop:358 length:240 start_codon:yes stop_codon:yes gene_type:complete